MNVASAFRAPRPIETVDCFAADVVAGLTAKPKSLPPKYFYDLAGSALFDRITQLPEYYPTRCELGILQDNAPAIASVAEGALAKFRQTIAALQEQFAAHGFNHELTGPWPPYHFVSVRQEGIADAATPDQ